MNEEAQKKVRLMVYWLFGTVVIVWAAVITAVGLVALPMGAGWDVVLGNTWPLLLIVLVLAIAVGLVYRYVLLPRQAVK